MSSRREVKDTVEQRDEERNHASAKMMYLYLVGNIVNLGFAIAAIVIGQKGDPPCAKPFGGIHFDLATWFYSSGIIGCFMCSLHLLATVSVCHNYSKGFVFNQMTYLLTFRFYAVLALFHFCWTCVQAILFFATLKDCRGEPSWNFGLVMFTFQVAPLYLAGLSRRVSEFWNLVEWD